MAIKIAMKKLLYVSMVAFVLASSAAVFMWSMTQQPGNLIMVLAFLTTILAILMHKMQAGKPAAILAAIFVLAAVLVYLDPSATDAFTHPVAN